MVWRDGGVAKGLWALEDCLWQAVYPCCFCHPPTQQEADALDAWETKSDKAAGWLYLMVEQEQRVHFNGIQDSPVKMWKALEAVHRQKKAGMRFNAYDELFGIRKLEEETLQSLINIVEGCKRRIKELRPSSFTLDMLDDELASMALIRALPDDYASFSSSLLLMDKLDQATIHQAFVTEDIQRRKRAGDTLATSQALVLECPNTHTCPFLTSYHYLPFWDIGVDLLV